jgi:hypothetical protein
MNISASYCPSIASAASLLDHSSVAPAISGLVAIDGVSSRLTTEGIADSCRTMRSPAARNDLAALGSLIALTSSLFARDIHRRVLGTSALRRVGWVVKRSFCLCTSLRAV